jgi:ABC-type Fe3+ transport system permease subunit
MLPQLTVHVLLLLMGGVLCVRLMPLSHAIFFRSLRPFDLGKWRLPALAATLLLFAILIAVPLASLVYKAGVDVHSSPTGLPARSWSLTKLVRMTALESYLHFGSELRSSLIVGAIATIGSLATAVCLAWFGRRGQFRAIIVGTICAVLLALPGPALGGLLSRVLVHFPPIYDSYAAPALALWLKTLPLATLILWHAFRSLPQDTWDAARLDGAGTISCLTLLAIPMRWPAVALAGLVVFLVALGDLSASQLLQVPGKETLATRVFDRLHSGAYDQVSGMFLSLFVLFGATAVVICWLGKKITQSARSDLGVTGKQESV